MKRTHLAFLILGTLSFLLIASCGKGKKGHSGPKISLKDAKSELNDLISGIDWTQNYAGSRAKLKKLKNYEIKDTLPDINQFKLFVNPRSSSSNVVAEIFVSAEKAGKGTDGWLVEMGKRFNNQNFSLSNGKKAKVSIRKISSGIGYQFIASKKHLPDAYTPSQVLWMDMIRANNIKLTPITEKLAGNYGGIVIKKKVYEQLNKTYGEVGLKAIVDATVKGDIAMGYTNPFSSSTGLNFLISVLYTFADGDESKMLSEAVASSLRSFQKGVPFIAMNTPQMRDSAQEGGSLDAFVMDMKTWQSSNLVDGTKFIPFGIPHDNPLYAIGDVSTEKLETLKKFAAFVASDTSQKTATKYGFNGQIDHKSLFKKTLKGTTLTKAQKLWKEEKDAGRPIAAVFLTDVSGSMSGDRLIGLKKALKIGADFINSENHVGLVTFSSSVNVLIPIKKFNFSQKSHFLGGVKQITASGSTAMYNGILVSLKLLMDKKAQDKSLRPMLFVLTDGQTNVGNKFSDIKDLVRALNIPIYTIGYEANIKELKRLSSLVEAASINAKSADVPYKIGSLLNAEL